MYFVVVVVVFVFICLFDSLFCCYCLLCVFVFVCFCFLLRGCFVLFCFLFLGSGLDLFFSLFFSLLDIHIRCLGNEVLYILHQLAARYLCTHLYETSQQIQQKQLREILR